MPNIGRFVRMTRILGYALGSMTDDRLSLDAVKPRGVRWRTRAARSISPRPSRNVIVRSQARLFTVRLRDPSGGWKNTASIGFGHLSALVQGRGHTFSQAGSGPLKADGSLRSGL